MGIIGINKFFSGLRTPPASGPMPVFMNTEIEQARSDWSGAQERNISNRRWFMWSSEDQRWGSNRSEVVK